MIAILVGAVLFGIPIGIIVFQAKSGPSPYEQIEEMWKDPKQRSRLRRMVLGIRRRTPKIPPPRPPISAVAPERAERSESELLADLIAEPRDPGTRMVYADWLEQHGDAVKAAFVRGALIDNATDSEREQLLATTDLAWRAATSSAPVPQHECETVRWSELRVTAGDVLVRECPYCTQQVRYCAEEPETRIAIARDELAILDPGLDTGFRYATGPRFGPLRRPPPI